MYAKNWKDFQHYTKRNPPWIKLHKKLLDDYEYQCLPLASRALAPMLWLLASESSDGHFDAASEKLAFRLRVASTDVVDGIIPLIIHGFFVDDLGQYPNASNVLATCYSDAMPETERETEKPTSSNRCTPQFAKSDETEGVIDLDAAWREVIIAQEVCHGC